MAPVDPGCSSLSYIFDNSETGVWTCGIFANVELGLCADFWQRRLERTTPGLLSFQSITFGVHTPA